LTSSDHLEINGIDNSGDICGIPENHILESKL
jgi:hypothetical protein